MKRQIPLFTLVIFSFIFGHAQTGTKSTKFWFGFMENLTLDFNGPPSFTVIVSADELTTFKIFLPQTGLQFSYTIGGGDVREIKLPDGIFYGKGCDVTTNFGFCVESQKPISVKVFHNRAYFTDASIVLPASMLGTKYSVLTRKDANTFTKNPNSFLVIATEDKTRVIITPSVNTGSLRPAGRPYEISLDKGQTYQVQAVENLSGTTLEAMDGKKIAVFCGARQSFVNKPECDEMVADNHLYEQIPPVQYAATEFVYVPIAKRGGDPISILSLNDNTVIYFNGQVVKRIGKSSFDTLLTAPTLITSNNPLLIAQFSKSAGCSKDPDSTSMGDPSMFFMQPTSVAGQNESFYTPSGFYYNFVTVICKTNDTATFILDNKHPTTRFTVVDAAPKYSYLHLKLNEGNHNIKSNLGFNAYSYGFGDFNAYSFGIGYTTDVPDEKTFYKPYLYPNPFVNNLKILYGLPATASLDITCNVYDAIGRQLLSTQKVLTSKNSEIELNLESLAAACYFVRIIESGRNKTHTFKVIKMERKQY